MWFDPERSDSGQFWRALWTFARWLMIAPLLGGLVLAGFCLVAGVSREAILPGILFGAMLGFMAGVLVTGSALLARWKV